MTEEGESRRDIASVAQDFNPGWGGYARDTVRTRRTVTVVEGSPGAHGEAPLHEYCGFHPPIAFDRRPRFWVKVAINGDTT